MSECKHKFDAEATQPNPVEAQRDKYPTIRFCTKCRQWIGFAPKPEPGRMTYEENLMWHEECLRLRKKYQTGKEFGGIEPRNIKRPLTVPAPRVEVVLQREREGASLGLSGDDLDYYRKCGKQRPLTQKGMK